MEEPIVNDNFLLEKFPGKGGWTYAMLPNIRNYKKGLMNWVKVNGTIDDFEIKNFSLLPMGNGKLFLPVKATIRKSIGKEQGDYVKVVLFPAVPVSEVAEELLLCLEDEPKALTVYESLTAEEQTAFTNWIAAARTDDIKVERIAKSIDMLQNGKRLPVTVK